MATEMARRCASCGTPLGADMAFCPNCGAGTATAAGAIEEEPVEPTTRAPWDVDAAARRGADAREWSEDDLAPAVERTSGKARVSLLLGLLGIPFAGLVLGPVAILFGLFARRDIAEVPGMRGARLATAGILLGSVALLLNVVFTMAALSG